MAEPATTEKDDPKTKRSMHRSPRYPGLSLEAAIERVQTIYDHEKKTPAKIDVILGHLGLKPGTGPAHRVIAALRQYGLLEPKDAYLRVSDLAFKILYLSEESQERQEALREAAYKPQIIKDVFVEFPDGLPSDANLSDYLVSKKSFNPESVAFFVGILRKNLALVPLGTQGYEEPEEEEAMSPEIIENPPPERRQPALGGKVAPIGSATGEQERLRFSLSGGRTVRLIFGGPAPTQAEIDDLMDYLKISRRTFPSAASTPESSE